MQNNKCFFDTNILLYLLSGDQERADKAEAIFSMGGVISIQVLNEFSSVASRKLRMSYPEIRETLLSIRAVCKIQLLTIEVHETGLDIAERYGFSLCDSMIVSAALESGCNTLYSEDMQHEQEIGASLLIVNPLIKLPQIGFIVLYFALRRLLVNFEVLINEKCFTFDNQSI